MKNILKTILILTTIILMSSSQVFASSKIPSNVTLIGNEIGINFTKESDEFLQIDNILPGDSCSGIINIKNESNDTFDLYMRIEKYEKNPKFNILDKLVLRVSNKDGEIYNGSVNQSETLEKNIYLGSFNRGNEDNIKIDLLLDGESTGNEYINKNGEIEWIFTAIQLGEEDFGGDKPSVGNLPNTGQDGIYVIIIIASIAIIFGLCMMESKKKNK